MNLDKLKEKDFTIIVDRSGSMGSPDSKSGKSRWRTVQESVEAVAHKLTELDPDGITVYEFSDNFTRYDNTTGEKVRQVFQKDPGGSTNLASVLNHAFSDYLQRKTSGKTKLNGELMVVATDGAPNDPEKVSKEIINCTKRLDSAEELQVIFLQVGDDTGASIYLKSLDDDLQAKGAKFDIVSVIGMDKIGDLSLTDVFMKAITEGKIN